MSKRRATHYPIQLKARVSENVGTSIKTASDKYGIAEGVIVRDAIERGYKAALAELRRTARREAASAA